MPDGSLLDTSSLRKTHLAYRGDATLPTTLKPRLLKFMSPVFTVNYPELLIANHLQKLFPKAKDYSVLIPLSSQQKGYDIALMRHQKMGSRVVTFQVKSSRTYEGVPGIAPRTKLRTFAHYMWLNKFTVPREADFFILLGLYAPSPTSLKNSANVWHPHILLFTQEEMKTLIAGIRQRTTNKEDKYFGFGFDNPNEAFLTRGHAKNEHPNYSHHLLERRHHLICDAL